MVLEETLLFLKNEDADEFVSFLRNYRCPVQKIVISSVYHETLIAGPIGSLIQFIEKAHTVEPESEETPDATPSVSHKSAIQSLNAIRSFVAGLMDRYECGDIIYTPENYNRLKMQRSDIPMGEEMDEFLKELAERTPIFEALLAMMNCGWVKNEPEGFRLLQKFDPNTLPVERQAPDPDRIDRDATNKLGLFLNARYYYGEDTRLIIDPRIHTACNAGDVREALKDLDVDEAEVGTLLCNMYDKDIAINAVLDAISQAGRCSLAELIEKMDALSLKEEGATDRMTGHFTPGYVISLVNDLRKIGRIAGNDRKLRAVR